MNILFIMNGLRLGGMERQLVELIKALQGSQVKAHLAILNARGVYSDIVQQYLNSPVVYLDRRKSKIPATLRALHNLFGERQIDIIHVQDSFSCYYALPVAKWNKLPLINGMIRHAGVSKGLEYYIQCWMLRLSDIIVANSKAGLAYYKVQDGYVIYNIIDVSRFQQRYGPLQNVVMIANFTKFKDQETLIRASARLIKEGRIKKVAFIGDGPHKEACEKLSKELNIQDHTFFYGHISTIESTIINYGIGVLCSTRKYKEGISNSILEYMGTGLIAVASDVGATSEIIEEGVNGFLFEAENAKSLYEKLQFILGQNNLDDIRQNGRSTLVEKFDVNSNIQKIIGIYQSVNI